MTKYPLKRTKKIDHRSMQWASCLPFVENSRGVLIHRPRSGATYNIHTSGPHVAIGFWCGMSVSSSGKHLTFHEEPPADRIVCARCEAIAVANGLPSADDLAGRHVHVGRTIAVATCCENMGGAYLTRVNEKGVPGVWECRPACESDLPQETLLMMAIEGDDTKEEKP